MSDRGVRGGGESRFMGSTCITQTSGVHSSSPQVDREGLEPVVCGLDLNLLPAPTAYRGRGERTVRSRVSHDVLTEVLSSKK